MQNTSPKMTHLELWLAMSVGIVGVDALCWWGIGAHTFTAVAMVGLALFLHWLVGWVAEWDWR